MSFGSQESTSLEILLIIAVFTTLFSIPILRFLYRRYISIIMKIAGEKLEEVKSQVAEKMADTNRKLAERMRA